MDDFITTEEIEEIEQWYNQQEEEEVDPDMEVWMSNLFELDDEFVDENVNDENISGCVPVENNEALALQVNETSNTRELTNNQRKDIVDKLLVLFDGKILARGAQKKIAEQFRVHRITVWRIWKTVVTQMAKKELICVDSKKKWRVGRKPKEWNFEQLTAILVEKRTTIRALANALQIGLFAVYRLIKAGKLRAHSNSIKLTVGKKNRLARLRYIRSQIIPPIVSTLPKFSNMYNVVHIDEKWFFMSQQTQKFYLFPWEADPYRHCQSKLFIPKVMFMGAGARPRADWDWKIGIFPFTSTKFAKRSSKNRVRETEETKAMQYITQEVITFILIEIFLLTITVKCLQMHVNRFGFNKIMLGPMLVWMMLNFDEAASIDGFDLRLICQPAQSPDLNILDLGFFRAIQSLQYKEFPQNVDELVKSVEAAYNAFDNKLLNYTWLHHYYCMLEIMKVKCSNNYKNPHYGKIQMDREGLLPEQIEVDMDAYIQLSQLLEDGE